MHIVNFLPFPPREAIFETSCLFPVPQVLPKKDSTLKGKNDLI